MSLRTFLLSGLLVPMGAFPVLAQGTADRALDDNVQREDPSFGWEVRRSGEVAGVRYTEALLTSQTWRGIPWRHQLFVIWPGTMPDEVSHALLHVDSGRWDDRLADLEHVPDLPRQAPLFALLAELLATPLAIVRQVPFQPLFDGLTEDALISYTFDQYLRTGEEDWPLLLPMVKSAVSAMDAVEEMGRDEAGVSIRSFTVTGASKRGWTTWLTGAVDPRVRAIVPMVIDVLNMPVHLDHQLAAWGEYSEQIRDYTDRGIFQVLDTPRGRTLTSIVDPYHYRERLTFPKLIVIGTNDPYWPLDALNLYWDELPEPRRILYMPNTGHGADDYPRLLGSLAAMHRNVVDGDPPLPDPGWEFEEAEDRLRLRVWADVDAESVEAWSATSPTRDFREAHWTSRACAPDGDGYVCEIPRPDQGYAALFADMAFPGVWILPFHLSTQVRIIEAADPGPD
jgi:PhoPQ-activated pathogenicity-related protein